MMKFNVNKILSKIITQYDYRNELFYYVTRLRIFTHG